MTDPHARPVTAEQVTDAVLAGSWVIDLRDRATFARGHLPGTVNVEHDDERFAAHVGWLVPWDDDIVLLTDDADVLGPALRRLAEIGVVDVAAHVVEDGEPLTARYRRADWAAFRDAWRIGAVTRRPPAVIDVRRLDEWRAGHLPGAIHVPLEEVERTARRLPRGELWVHSGDGRRAGIAASLLHRAGRAVVHVDDSWERVGALRIDTIPAAA